MTDESAKAPDTEAPPAHEAGRMERIVDLARRVLATAYESGRVSEVVAGLSALRYALLETHNEYSVTRLRPLSLD